MRLLRCILLFCLPVALCLLILIRFVLLNVVVAQIHIPNTHTVCWTEEEEEAQPTKQPQLYERTNETHSGRRVIVGG